MLSVNTNPGAMVALQYLNQTNAELQATQAQVSTGLKVASAKDDGATYAIAQNMRGDVAGYQSVTDSLNRGISAVECGAVRGSVDLRSADPDEAEGPGCGRCRARHGKPPGPERRLPGAPRSDHLDRQERGLQQLQHGGRFNKQDYRTGVFGRLAPNHGRRREYVAVGDDRDDRVRMRAISTQSSASTMIATVETSLTNVNSALARLSSGSAKSCRSRPILSASCPTR